MPRISQQDYRRLADGLLACVLSAGSLQMRYLGSDIAVIAKPDASPVTAADHESESVLLAGLAAVAPNVPVVAEERAAAGFVPKVAGTFFAVDPLDGTKDFIAGRPDFTINIGLISDGVPAFGIIYAPAHSAMYLTTAEGESAYCYLPTNALVSSFSECRFERLRTRAPEPGALRALTSRSRPSEISDAFLQRAGVSDAQPTGSSLKFCLIAQGRADLYARFGPTNEWDTAAGQAILAAAGGAVVTMDGQPLSYGKTDARFLNPEFIAWGRQPPQP
ncbi:MAG: 3'(2'),5'-bisphosphate nucleotidase CysQ [Hyphomicrobiaceae bacterium]|nr:3'(2'),5'-bisphosphate nucleotidase CysQ [Hyphomicrobiaceae bacterium]